MSNQPLHIAILGGGAAGYFAAIEAKRNCPDANITIFEKSKKSLELGVRNWCAARILNFELWVLIPTERTEMKGIYYKQSFLCTLSYDAQRLYALWIRKKLNPVGFCVFCEFCGN